MQDLQACTYMDENVFAAVHFLPDPVPEDGHYKSFFDLYGQLTTEEFRSTGLLQQSLLLDLFPVSKMFYNVGLLVQYEECDNVETFVVQTQAELLSLKRPLTMLFTELELPGRLKNVCVKGHKCYNPIEKLYYSCGFELICDLCASEEVQDDPSYLPQCVTCQEKGTVRIKRPQRKK